MALGPKIIVLPNFEVHKWTFCRANERHWLIIGIFQIINIYNLCKKKYSYENDRDANISPFC